MSQWLSMFAALAEGLSSVLSIHTRWLTIACCSSSSQFNTSGLCGPLYLYAHLYTCIEMKINIELKINLKKNKAGTKFP